MTRQAGSSKHTSRVEGHKPGKPAAGQNSSQKSEPCQDILLAARSLGFSYEELLEIKRLYQPMSEGQMK